MPAPLLSWLCHALQYTASCLYVNILPGCALPNLVVCTGAAAVSSNAFTWHVCLLPHEGQFFVVELPIPEVEGVPSLGCLWACSRTHHCISVLYGVEVLPMLGSIWTVGLLGPVCACHALPVLREAPRSPDIVSLKYTSCCIVYLRSLLWPKLVLKRLSVHP